MSRFKLGSGSACNTISGLGFAISKIFQIYNSLLLFTIKNYKYKKLAKIFQPMGIFKNVQIKNLNRRY